MAPLQPAPVGDHDVGEGLGEAAEGEAEAGDEGAQGAHLSRAPPGGNRGFKRTLRDSLTENWGRGYNRTRRQCG